MTYLDMKENFLAFAGAAKINWSDKEQVDALTEMAWGMERIWKAKQVAATRQ